MIKSRRMQWVGQVEQTEELRNAYKILVRTHEGRTPVRRCKHRCVGITGMDAIEIGWEDVGCIYLAQDRDQLQALVNVVTNLWIP
jgi:hypothetical protein